MAYGKLSERATMYVQGSTNRRAPGLVNFVPALAHHFCLNLPSAFTQPGACLLVEPCTVWGINLFLMSFVICFLKVLPVCLSITSASATMQLKKNRLTLRKHFTKPSQQVSAPDCACTCSLGLGHILHDPDRVLERRVPLQPHQIRHFRDPLKIPGVAEHIVGRLHDLVRVRILGYGQADAPLDKPAGSWRLRYFCTYTVWQTKLGSWILFTALFDFRRAQQARDNLCQKGQNGLFVALYIYIIQSKTKRTQTKRKIAHSGPYYVALHLSKFWYFIQFFQLFMLSSPNLCDSEPSKITFRCKSELTCL